MHYDKVTRLLHWGFTILIPLQLLSEELMKRPKPGRIREDMQIFFFDMHEWIGLIATALLVARVAWGFVGAEGGWKRLFPYMTTSGRGSLTEEIRTDIPNWFKGKVPVPGQEDYLAGAVHGLGLLLALALGLSGVIMSFGMQDTGQMLGFIHLMKEFHELLGEVLWIYIYGHVGMVIVHLLLKHPVFARIFSFKN